MKVKKLVYTYEDANPKARKLLGGKGSGLVLMYKKGLPVPTGSPSLRRLAGCFTSPTRTLPEGLMDQVREAMRWLEEKTDRRFGDQDNPLLVSGGAEPLFRCPA